MPRETPVTIAVLPALLARTLDPSRDLALSGAGYGWASEEGGLPLAGAARPALDEYLLTDLVASLDAAFDHANSGEFREAGSAWIGTIRSNPVDHMGDRMVAHLNAAVILADRLDLLDFLGGLVRGAARRRLERPPLGTEAA